MKAVLKFFGAFFAVVAWVVFMFVSGGAEWGTDSMSVALFIGTIFGVPAGAWASET